MCTLFTDVLAVLGTRTKAQENALPQLIVQVERNKEGASAVELPNTPTAKPKVGDFALFIICSIRCVP